MRSCDIRLVNSSSGSICSLKESFSSVRTGNSLFVKATLGLDGGFNPCVPFSVLNGYVKPILDPTSPIDMLNRDLDSFIHSRNAFYSNLRVISLICILRGTYDLETKTWKADTIMQFYAPTNYMIDSSNPTYGKLMLSPITAQSVIYYSSKTVLGYLSGAVVSKKDYLRMRCTSHLK